VLTDLFPELSETFVVTEARALQAAGHRVRIEAGARPASPNPDGSRGLAVSYLDDDDLTHRLTSVGWLAARHPLGCLRDLARRWRWRREEAVRSLRSLAPAARRIVAAGDQHIHVHFAGTAGLDALRLSRLLGVRYSLTAHAYDIFQLPRNLSEKLEGAATVTTGCRYNVDYLQRLLGPEHGDRVHEIIMGVDAERFRRRTPYPAASTLLAIGRLVEKKGFAHLIDAVARLEPEGVLDSVKIVGDGPLRDALREQVRTLGLEHRIELLGNRDPEGVRDLLEEASVLAMPCVVASDGDRDSMPVVVKEALAMEVPVVASDEVGLPELIHSEWGRLVPPGDPDELAAAIRDLVSLPPEERARMGRAGRAWVIERCDPVQEAAKLAALISDGAVPPSGDR
jgi:glycosyltransferase involved in cell wall biosynthesis